jgi:hypothetical protein
MVVQCCLCKRVRNGREWAEPVVSEVADGDVSHGYCPVCAAKAFEEIEDLLSTRRRLMTTLPARLKAC